MSPHYHFCDVVCSQWNGFPIVCQDGCSAFAELIYFTNFVFEAIIDVGVIGPFKSVGKLAERRSIKITGRDGVVITNG